MYNYASEDRSCVRYKQSGDVTVTGAGSVLENAGIIRIELESELL